MRNKTRGGSKADGSSARRRGATARRAAILLGGTAAMALLISQPASAISINDAFFPPDPIPMRDTASNYYDSTNKFPNVAVLIDVLTTEGTFCTGSLINSRTILTAAHCYRSQFAGAGVGISFNPIASTSD